MPTLTFITCGTSLLTNGIEQPLRTLIGKYANTTDWDEVAPDDKAPLQAHVQERAEQLLRAERAHICKLSAELNGLLAWQRDNADDSAHPQNAYMLIATDTVLGQATAAAIADWLNAQGQAAHIISESGLNTASRDSFRQALSALTKLLVETIEGYRQSGYRIHFNLTGGFKGINGFLQAVASVYADQTYYLFERSEELLYIPRLPYRLDAAQTVRDNLTAFRRLSNDLPITTAQANGIPELWRFDIDDEFMLSEWGMLIWQDTMPKLYRQDLLDSPSERITLTTEFTDSCKKLKPALIALINKRIDMLAVYLEGDSKQMLQSLDVKALQAKVYRDQNMYECDLDGNHRIFMVKDGHHMTLKQIHDALH